MAILKSGDGKELIVSCSCGCDEGVHIIIEKDHIDGLDAKTDTFAYVTCLSGNFYREQEMTILDVVKIKFRKIWAIIHNKDFYYSEVCMTRKDFETFREYINGVDGGNE